MVYLDVPVTDFSSNLIGNDIDLTVKAKGGSRVVYPNNLSSADRYNNQEQITLTKLKLSDLIGSGEKTLEITVTRSSLLTEYQVGKCGVDEP